MGKLTNLHLSTSLTLGSEPGSGAVRNLKRRIQSIIIASAISGILFLLFFSPNQLKFKGSNNNGFNPSQFFSLSRSSFSSYAGSSFYSSSSTHLFGPSFLKPIEIPYDPSLFGLNAPADWNNLSLASTITDLNYFHWPAFLTSNRLLKASEPLPVKVFPRIIKLNERAPLASELIFGMTTTAERASVISELWTGWLKGREEKEEGPLSVVVLPESDFKDNGSGEDKSRAESLNKKLKEELGLNKIRLTKSWLGESARYESRYFGMLREMVETASSSNENPKWFIVSDDDTLWTDQRMLRRELSNYDPDELRLLGASSEGVSQIHQFGNMAFGGAGIIISRGLCKRMIEILSDCVEETKNVFGGDEMYSLCAARAVGDGKTKESVVTQLNSLHQLDLPGDGTGFFQSGLPFLSLHHLWHGWTDAFAREHQTNFDRSDNALNHLLLLQQAAKILGGDNFMKRIVFKDGGELLTLGYTVTRFENPLKPEDLAIIEKTWSGDSDFPVRFPIRRRIVESNEPLIHQIDNSQNDNSTGGNIDNNNSNINELFGKRTYYLCEIRQNFDPVVTTTASSSSSSSLHRFNLPTSFTLVHRDRWGNIAEIVWKDY